MSFAQEKEKLTSLSLEREVIASLLKNQDLFYEIESVTSDKDFVHPFHATCFCVIKDCYSRKEKIDKVILSQRLQNLGLSKFEEVDTFAYIENISYIHVNKETGRIYCEELSKLRLLRDLIDQNNRTKEYILNNRDKSISDIVPVVDNFNNELIKKVTFNDNIGENIFESMERNIEFDATNPPKDFWQGPFKTVNKIFGSITIPSNITLIGARTGANKTNLALFYALHLATKYDVPIIYCDYGELNLRSIQNRCLAMLCRGAIPYHMLVRGTWRSNDEYTKIIRGLWKKIKNLKLFYHDVGNMNPNDILSLIRRSYYSKIGRAAGSNCLLIYDYLKPFNPTLREADWQLMAKFAQDLKTLINNEIPIPAWMSIQMNRMGITNNKKASQVDDSENSLQIDRVLHNASLCFLLRQKTTDELLEENNAFGGIKMIPVKHREVLGEDFQAVLKPVRMMDGSFRKNYINLDMRNFYFEDRGDCHAMVHKLSNQVSLTPTSDPSDIIVL